MKIGALLAAVGASAILPAPASAATIVFNMSFEIAGTRCSAFFCGSGNYQPTPFRERISFSGDFHKARFNTTREYAGKQYNTYTDHITASFLPFSQGITGFYDNAISNKGEVLESMAKDGNHMITFRLGQSGYALPSNAVEFSFLVTPGVKSDVKKSFIRDFASLGFYLDNQFLLSYRLDGVGEFKNLYSARGCSVKVAACLPFVEALEGKIVGPVTYDIYEVPVPEPLPGEIGAIPEPATWAMMITGFSLVGFAMRKRRGRRAVGCAYRLSASQP